MNSDIKNILESKLRDDLNIIARKLRITGYRKFIKDDLVSSIMKCDEQRVRRALSVTWWDRYHSHVYGLATIIALVLAIVFYVFPYKSPVPNKENTQKKEKQPEADKKFQTLHDYFKTDFSNYYAVNRNIGIRVFTDIPKREVTKDYELEFRLHCDFDSLTKFLSVYLPSSTFPNQISICKVVAQQSQDISSIISKGIIVSASRYDDRKTEISNLKFTGRVYIYHDAYLSDDEKDELRHFFKQQSLDPRFRGANYIEKRLLYNVSSSDD